FKNFMCVVNEGKTAGVTSKTAVAYGKTYEEDYADISDLVQWLPPPFLPYVHRILFLGNFINLQRK
ncbi:hypothetical protein TNCV_1869941, partial [Trichonephila clavipes]